MTIKELESIVEAILFASGEIVSVKSIAYATEQDEKTVKTVISNMIDKYKVENRGIRIIQVEDGYQMCTNAEYFNYIKKLYQAPVRKVLSTTLLETLAIIAYKQPVTKGQIEEIRGVSADHAVNRLVEYGLVKEEGRLDAPGKPILFGTSDEFLRYFGFNSLNNLPVSNTDLEQLRIEAEAEPNSRHSIISFP